MRFLVIVEKAKRNWSAYSPDLPGCVATGSTRPRTIARMRSAIRFHLEGLRAAGEPVPRPDSCSAIVEMD